MLKILHGMMYFNVNISRDAAGEDGRYGKWKCASVVGIDEFVVSAVERW
ncbi:MAG: hypothetical protein ISS35_06865 [Kiritimatiellae bacterium]|nr:hypothetical protein [Kiritimatiellia bacterium]